MLLSIIAVALSVALLIVVASLFGGFISTLENTSKNFIGDIVITPKGKFSQFDDLVRKLNNNKNIKAASPVLSTHGLLHLAKGKVLAVNIWGIDPNSRSEVSNFKSYLLNQKTSNSTPHFQDFGKTKILDGFVSIALLNKPDMETDKYNFQKADDDYIGKKAVLTTGSIMNAGDDDLENVSKAKIDDFKINKILFNISDIVFTGISQIDSKYVYLPIAGLSQLLYGSNEVNNVYANTIHIKVKDGIDPQDTIPEIWGIWSDFAHNILGWGSFAISNTGIETSRQLQSSHIAELENQMSMLLTIFGLISCAAILLIACIFYMIVITRIKDIAIIKSFGASSYSVMIIFICYGLFVGIIGSGIGFMLGFFTTKYINEIENWIRIVFGLKLWDSSVYLFSQAPNTIDWSAVLWILPSAIAASAIGAAIPALTAARVKPIKILQYE